VNYLFNNGAIDPSVTVNSYVAPADNNVVTAYSGSLDDNYVGNVPIGFTFNYFGSNVTKVFVGTNGTINLGTTGSTQYSFTGPPAGFPSTSNPASTIAVCARDLYATTGSISYWTEGVAPTRRFIVQYDGISTFSGSGVENAEVVMFESTGVVEIHIISATNGTATSTSASAIKYIGLQDATRTIGATATNCTTNVLNYWNGQSAEITTPKAWRFNPPVNYTFAWTSTPSTTIANAALENTTSVIGAGSTVYSVAITNPLTGCVKNDAVTIVGDATTVAGTVAGSSQYACNGNNTGTITLSGNTGSVVRWESSPNGTTYTTIAGETGTTYTYNNITADTYYRAVVKNGNCNEANTNAVMVTVNNAPNATVALASCGTQATFTVTPTGMNAGYTGTYSGTFSNGTTFTNQSAPISVSIPATATTAVTLSSLTADLGGCTSNTATLGSAITLNVYYQDADADTYGDLASTNVCNAVPTGYVTNSTDCNDNNNAINPGMTEICGNAVDENCDGNAEICSNDQIATAFNVTGINTFGTGSQYTTSINLVNSTNSPQSPGTGNDVWFKFVAQENAVRIALTGSATVADDNDLGLYNAPADVNAATQLIPISTENDVHPGNVGTLNADGGSETMIFDQLVPGNIYYICIRNNNNAPATTSMTIGYLRGSAADIMPYTNNTGIYSNTCQNFKAAFRPSAVGYTVNRWTTSADLTNGATPSYTYAIPAGTTTSASTICQLGRIVSANLGTAAVVYYVSVDVAYNLNDAAGNPTPVTALGRTMSSFTLSPEADLNVRTTDRCPIYKSATTGSLATNRSVCGANRYEWSFAQTLPSAGLPVTVQGALGGSRILTVASIPGIGPGQTYNTQIRANHYDGVTNTAYGTTACIRTLGTAGMPTVEEGGVIAERSENGVTTSIYPNPNNGQSVNFAVSGMEGDLNVRITDATGRMVYANRYIVEGSLNTTIDFGQSLAGGVYMVEMIQNGQMKTMRMVVSK
jgi:hypothetical protein